MKMMKVEGEGGKRKVGEGGRERRLILCGHITAPAGAAGSRRDDSGPERGRPGPQTARLPPAELRRERAEHALEPRRAARTARTT